MNGIGDLSAETLRSLYDATRGARQVRRDINVASGLTFYDLQKPAKQITPFYFPLSDLVPRVGGQGDTATRWKAVTALNTQLFEGFVGEGNRAKTVSTTVVSKSANYATIYQEDAVTFEAKGAAAGFEDLQASTAMRLMWATLQEYENALLGANTSLALGTPTAPTLADVTTGGGIAQTITVHVGVVALTPYGARASSVAAGVAQPTTYTAPDGSSYIEGYGASQISADSSVTTATDGLSTHRVTATVPAVAGAVAYAWFWGATAATRHLGAITYTNSANLTVAVGTGAQLSTAITADTSENPLGFDGFLTQAFQSGTLVTQATGTPGTGTGLTASGAGTITEIDTLLQTLWDTQRISPVRLVVNSQELRNIYAKVMANGGSPLIRFNLDASSGAEEVVAGRVMGSYINQFTSDGGQLIKLVLHPNCPKGTILAMADRVPVQLFPGNNLGQLYEFHMPEDGEIRQIEWPLRTRKYETGVQLRGALAHYFPASMGVITNIANA